MNKIKRKKIKVFDVGVYSFWIITCLICIVPIFMLFSNSITLESDLIKYGWNVIPRHVSFEGWKWLFKNSTELGNHLFATFMSAIVGPGIDVLFLAMIAYPLSRGNKFFATKFLKIFLLVLSVIPGGGAVVGYVLNINVFHLGNNMLMYLIPPALGLGTFVFASYFKTAVPEELLEASHIDGATEMQLFIRIVMPLMAPVIATRYFLAVVGAWKDYMTSLMYMTDPWKQTLEYYVQSILEDSDALKRNLVAIGYAADSVPVNSMKVALCFFSAIPLLLIFPYFQKFFKKGAIVGSIKG